MIARRMGHLLGEDVHWPQAGVVVTRLSSVFRAAPLVVALASLKVVCIGMPTSKRFGGAPCLVRSGAAL